MRALLKLISPVALAVAIATPAWAADASAATKAFEEVCLANAGSADAARAAALGAGFTQGETLPQLTSSRGALETYNRPPLELVVREARSGSFGCIVLFGVDDGVGNEAVAQAVTALQGLSMRSSKGGKEKWRASWTPAVAPKGSKVILTIDNALGDRTAILSLESEAKR